MVMNGEKERMWKEAVMIYFKALPQYIKSQGSSVSTVIGYRLDYRGLGA
jgi:hypothetical protein